MEVFGIEQFTGKDRLFLVFVRIERCNAQSGGTILFRSQTNFLQLVLLPVPGKEKGRPVGNLQVFRRNRHTLFLNGPDLTHQHLRVQRHAVTDDIHNFLAEDAGRKGMDLKLTELVDYGVAGVGAALIPDDYVKSFRQ